MVTHLRNTHGTVLRNWGDLGWGKVRLWVDNYDGATHLPLSETERRWLPREILRVFLVGVATAILQDDPVELILRQGEDLELFIWLSQQKDFFL